VAKTFMQMVGEAKAEVPNAAPTEVQACQQQGALVIDVQEPDGVKAKGTIPGSMNIPLGVLPIRADTELPEGMREAPLQDRDQAIVVTCTAGGQAALGAKMLKDMGFTNVSYVEGGHAPLERSRPADRGHDQIVPTARRGGPS
jgi:rhodanese-related sulfurtransferase